MKKIIYSLVIMIAAGSLFTSCIEQVEPEGILALREAKARYYDALSKLRAADEEYRRAEAEVQKALADVERANAEKIRQETADAAAMKELLREAQEIQNADAAAELAAKIDSLEKAMELAAKQHEIDLIEKQQALAAAQEALRVALRNIALAAQDLTDDEKVALVEAAMVYYELYEAVLDQRVEVLEKEQALAKAQADAAKADLEWDSEEHEYADARDLLERDIARAKAYKAYFEEALANVPAPNIEDLDKWKAELDKYEAEKAELEYSRHKITQDSAALMVEYHDAFGAYASAVASWISSKSPFLGTVSDNKGYPMADPATLDEDYVPVDPEGATVYVVRFGFELEEDNALGKAGDEFNHGDVVGASATGQLTGLTELEITPTPAMIKFDYLLGSYNPVTVDGTPETVYNNGVLTPDADMSAFILGDSLGTVGSQKLTRYDDEGKPYTAATANYGLWGAYYTLLRDKVLFPDDADDEATIKKQRDAAYDIWKAHRDTLEAGLLNYGPYKDALQGLKDAQESEKEHGNAMVAAIAELIEALESVNESNLSKNDSVRIIEAYAAFGKAREDYLEYKDPGDLNFDYYHFGYVVDGDVEVDSIKFSELTFSGLRKSKRWGKKMEDGTAFSAQNSALAHMAHQLLNGQFSNVIKNAAPWDFTGCDINSDSGTSGHNGFYNQYIYVPEDKTRTEHPEAHMETITGEYYESPVITKAKEAIDAAIARYEAIYLMYWGVDAYPATLDNTSTEDDIKAAAAQEIPVSAYLYETFMKPYNAVSFDGAEIMFTEAIGAILGSVENRGFHPEIPAGFGTTDYTGQDLDNGGVVTNNSITFGDIYTTEYNLFEAEIFADAKGMPAFNTARTDFYNLMAAEYRLWLVQHPATEDLELIKAWIETVAKEIADANAENAALAALAYELDKAAYDNFVAYADYSRELWTEFAGSYTSSGVLKFRPKITSITMGNNFTINYDGLQAGGSPGTAFHGTSSGSSWNSNLKGKQLEFAEKYLGGFPKAMYDLKLRKLDIDDQIAHLDILLNALKPAYLAAAKAKGYYDDFSEADNWDDMIADYEQLLKDFARQKTAYQQYLISMINYWDEEWDAAAKALADFESGVPAAELEVAKAQRDLDKAMFELEQLETLLQAAKDNLDRIIEYLKSQDANFVIPSIGGEFGF